MKKIISVLIALTLVMGAVALGEGATQTVRVASLKGPTTMGLVKLINDDDGAYEFTIEGTADAIVPRLVRGEIDIALIPCNLASVVYNNTQGAIEVLAINTLGVLYVVESGESVTSVSDLAGKTIYSTGKGTTPQFALNFILSKNGLDPERDVNIEYLSEAAEVAAAVIADQAAIAVLPQPYVTGVLAQNENLRVALSLSDEWDKVKDGSALITGVAVARREFVENNPQLVASFMEAYAASTAYVNENPAEAAEWICELGIVAKAPVAQKAIPDCNIVFIAGEEMQEKIAGYLAELFNQNPEAVGGQLPDEAFYYIPESD